jgi:hypothetical protein
VKTLAAYFTVCTLSVHQPSLKVRAAERNGRFLNTVNRSREFIMVNDADAWITSFAGKP